MRLTDKRRSGKRYCGSLYNRQGMDVQATEIISHQRKGKRKKNTNYLINLIEEKIQIAHQRTWENWVSPELGTRGPSQWNV